MARIVVLGAGISGHTAARYPPRPRWARRWRRAPRHVEVGARPYASRLDGGGRAVCVASTGKHIFKGSAASMIVYPLVPDRETYPHYGCDIDLTFVEIGLAGHWMKSILRHLFIHQATLRPGWTLLLD